RPRRATRLRPTTPVPRAPTPTAAGRARPRRTHVGRRRRRRRADGEPRRSFLMQPHSIASMSVSPPVAFVHDHLVQRGGSERVLVSMLRAYPDAPVFTAFYRPESTYPELREADVRCLPVDRVPSLRRHHRAAFPALPFF